jgi:hypothetical protein
MTHLIALLILIASCFLVCAILIYFYCKQDKWIEHDGGQCPVKASTLTLIKFEDGAEMSVNHPELLAWEYDAHINNINFYQVLS